MSGNAFIEAYFWVPSLADRNIFKIFDIKVKMEINFLK